MTSSKSPIPPEQLKRINEHVDKAVERLGDEIKRVAADALEASQDKVITAIEECLASPTARGNSAGAALASTNKGQDAEQEGKAWRLLIVVLPVALTAALGWWVWRTEKTVETRIAGKLEVQKSDLALTLSAKEDFLKKRNTVYESTQKQLSELVQALENAEVDADSRAKAVELLGDNDEYWESNSLYMSQNVFQQLKSLWDVATDLPFLRRGGKASLEQVRECRQKARTLMAEEIQQQFSASSDAKR